MLKPLKYLFVISASLFISTNATAINSNDKKLYCQARHLDTDKLVDVKIIPGIAGNKVATAQWPLGYPTIAIDNSAYIKLPKNVKRFVYYHECAHLTIRTENQHEADCESINSLIDRHDYKELDIRKLVKALVEKFGLSIRWSNLLACDGVLE